MTPLPPARVHVDRAAALTGVSRRTLYHWMAAGRLAFTHARASRLVALADVLQLKARMPGRGRPWTRP